MKVTGQHPVCKAICDALGFKGESVRALSIEMQANSLVHVFVEVYPEQSQLEELVKVIKRYHLVTVEDEPPREPKELTA